MRPLSQQARDTDDARTFWVTAQEATRKLWADVNRATFDRQRAVPLANALATLARVIEAADRSFENVLARLYGPID